MSSDQLARRPPSCSGLTVAPTWAVGRGRVCLICAATADASAWAVASVTPGFSRAGSCRCATAIVLAEIVRVEGQRLPDFRRLVWKRNPAGVRADDLHPHRRA
jgi:hypothetical protein